MLIMPPEFKNKIFRLKEEVTDPTSGAPYLLKYGFPASAGSGRTGPTLTFEQPQPMYFSNS